MHAYRHICTVHTHTGHVHTCSCTLACLLTLAEHREEGGRWVKETTCNPLALEAGFIPGSWVATWEPITDGAFLTTLGHCQLLCTLFVPSLLFLAW